MNADVIHDLRPLPAHLAVGMKLVELPQRHQEFGIFVRAGQFVGDIFKQAAVCVASFYFYYFCM